MRGQAGAAAMPGHKGEKTRIESVGGRWLDGTGKRA